MLRFVWIFLCISGSSFQIILLAIQYFSYEISTTVSFTYQDLIHFPSITVCNQIVELINWDDEKIREKCHLFVPANPNCGNQTESENIAKLRESPLQLRLQKTFDFLKLFSVKEIVTDLTVNMKELLLGYTIYNVKTGSQDPVFDFNQTFEISDFLAGLVKCSTFKWKGEHEVGDYLKLKRQFALSGMFLFLVANQEAATRVTNHNLIYGRNGIRFRNGHQDFIAVQASKGISSSSYDLFMSTLLKAPFATDCIDYSGIGFQNQGHCYDTCLEEVTIKKFGMRPLGMRLDNKHESMKIMTGSFLKANLAEVTSLEADCHKNCSRQDCYQELYVARIKSSTQETNGNRIAGHMSFVPSSPITVTTCTAKMTFADFATDVGSALGFWLGFSMLQSLHRPKKRVTEILTKVSRTRNRTVTRNNRFSNQKLPQQTVVRPLILQTPVYGSSPTSPLHGLKGWRV